MVNKEVNNYDREEVFPSSGGMYIIGIGVGSTIEELIYNAVSILDEEEQLLMIRIIIDYALLKKDPVYQNIYDGELREYIKAVFPAIRQSIKKHRKKYKR